MALATQQHKTSAATEPGISTQPTPERFFNAINAHQQTAAMKAAVELEIFTAIAEGNATAPAIAGRCRVAERGARILCDFLAIHGFLSKQGERYSNAPDAELFLNHHSPAYIGGAIEFLLTSHLRQAHGELTEAVRRGGTAIGQGTLEPENPDWVKFAKAMAPLVGMPAQMMAAELRKGGESRKVLDIAAGHGMFGIAVALQNPAAHIYAADWKNVLEVAQQNAANAGISSRYHVLPGSAFETDFGRDFDLVLIPNFLHHFDIPACTRFLGKAHASLQSGGRAAIAEFIPNPDRISPPTTAAFSMMMLATTPAGDAYTLAEYEQMLHNAGFSRSELSIDMGLNRLLIAYK
ncbi:MAG: methyltransferase domain-containing protein [Acidobacteria bacterium]|nr:methyltransferase domain-containing protein [Acidobacteriota bacterium]